MKKLVFLFLLFVPFFTMAKDINVVLIGGQSNASGQGMVANLPSEFEANKDVMLFYSVFLNKGEGSAQWGSLCPASDNKLKFGPELGLGNSLQEAFEDQKFALIKHSRSGSNLHTQWNPGNGVPEHQMGSEYAKFIATVKSGLDELVAQGYNPQIRAMVWQQGEADARTDAGAENTFNYPANLKNLIEQIRAEFSAEDMIFVYGKVLPIAGEKYMGRDVVRYAQSIVAESAGSDYSVQGAFMVECDDLQMMSADFNTRSAKDYVHLGTFGQLELGRRYAEVIVEQMKK